ncbi:hypothetical protein [Limimaricola hongkongensis]|uniref:hypothetical protein n=1 Tax=Limimaricola hongkongensis TaxID=278132 RepID=UPI00056C3C79|nr:hypothetical protein [Limimaricola hongkongensis]
MSRAKAATPIPPPAPPAAPRPAPRPAVEDAVLLLDPDSDLGPGAETASQSRPAAAPAPSPAPSLAPTPQAPLALLHAAGSACLNARAARIAPLVARIERLRARMIDARDGKR